MNRSDVHLLDLPEEILLIILKKLNNIDVLYSLWNINNERLNILAREKIFSNILNFESIDNISLIDRFCIDIFPGIHNNVNYFMLQPVSMDRILLATDYPNLTKLKLFNFTKEISSHYFTNESHLRHIFQQQITDLILVNHDKSRMIKSSENYTVNVYAHILNFFRNLKQLSIIETFNMSYPVLTFDSLPSTTLSSSTLTQLCIDVYTFDDCLHLLDGRLKQLTTLLLRIRYIAQSATIVHNMDNLPNLKCFSLKSYIQFTSYDNTVLSLLRRMSNLKKLTLYLRIKDRKRLIDGTHLENEILFNMPQLHSFTFYICTCIYAVDLSSVDIQRSFINIGQQHAVRVVNYINPEQITCSIFSIPFAFDRLEAIGNLFPDIIFSYVRYLFVQDVVPFTHEFFIRVARAFPLLKRFRILNYDSQSLCTLNNGQSYEIAKYPYLIYLDMSCANINYLAQFLNEGKTYVPRLTKLDVVYNNLRIVTNNFTNKETRRQGSPNTQNVLSSAQNEVHLNAIVDVQKQPIVTVSPTEIERSTNAPIGRALSIIYSTNIHIPKPPSPADLNHESSEESVA